jgi:hypothetical protein
MLGIATERDGEQPATQSALRTDHNAIHVRTLSRPAYTYFSVDNESRQVRTHGPLMTPTPIEFNRELSSRFGRWLDVQGYVPLTKRQYMVSVSSFCEFLDNIPAI